MERKLRLKTLLFLLLFVSGNCLAADYFGAIAYSRSNGADGWAKDHPSGAAAERAALAACRKHAKDCRALFWFKNGCGALAMSPSPDKAGWGWGTSQKLADAEAMKACAKQATNCKLKRQVCTAGAG